MPTISGIRRRGYTPESIRRFCDLIGVAKSDSTVDVALLEYCIREDLKSRVPRVMAVLDPVKVVLTNYPEGKTETVTLENNPENPEAGVRTVPFTRNLYIEKEDFMENPVKKFFRLSPGREVRLKGAYIIRCDEVVKNEDGSLREIRCTCDMASRSGTPGSDRKVKGTLHWVSEETAVDMTVRLYDYLIPPDDQDDGRDFMEKINSHSLTVMEAKGEPEILRYHRETGSSFYGRDILLWMKTPGTVIPYLTALWGSGIHGLKCRRSRNHEIKTMDAGGCFGSSMHGCRQCVCGGSRMVSSSGGAHDAS